jgi:hypothetical protein
MNELNTISLNVFVQLATVIFEKKKESVPEYARKSGLFKEDAIPQGTGDIRQYTEIDLEEYASTKREGDQSSFAKVQQGYSINISPLRMSKAIGITYEMRTRNKYSEVVNRLTNLGQLVPHRMDLDLSHRITFGTATTYTNKDGDTVDISLGDTYALFYSLHKVKGTSTTYRNILANNPQFARGSLELIEKQAMENSMNQFGEKMHIPFDIIWSTDDPNTVNTILETMRSIAPVEAINSGVENVYKGKYRHVILPRIATDANGLVDSTKAKYWGIASSGDANTAHLSMYEESHLQTPSTGGNGEDLLTGNWTFVVNGSYAIGIVNGLWIHMSKGSGEA